MTPSCVQAAHCGVREGGSSRLKWRCRAGTDRIRTAFPTDHEVGRAPTVIRGTKELTRVAEQEGVRRWKARETSVEGEERRRWAAV